MKIGYATVRTSVHIIMKQSQYWQNFELGKELEIAGGFVYDGLRNLHEMETLHYETEIFSVLYNLSVGLERFLKVAVVLLEYDDEVDPSEYEKSLITHNHLDLLNRIKKHQKLPLGKIHNEFLSLLGTFYKSYRYDRYSIRTVEELSKEKRILLVLLEKHLHIDISDAPPFKIVRNGWNIKKFIGKASGKIINALYEVISDAARSKNLYTYEVRYYSKTYKLLYGKEYDFESEDMLWKELLIFFLNTDQESPWLDYIRSIEPLEFDADLIPEYLQSFGSGIKKIEVTEELESLYQDVENRGDRIQSVSIIGEQGVYL
jgi:hypothetical protein